MAQAKITVSGAQAKALSLLVHGKKPVYPILYDPKSGVNLRETTGSETIEVPDNADLYNLKRFYSAGYFTVVEGKVADVTKFTSLSVDIATEPGVSLIQLNFDQPIYISADVTDAEGADFVIKLNDEVVPMNTIGAFAIDSATKTVSFDLGVGIQAGDVINFELKAAGAAKILDVGDVAVLPATYTVTVQ